jgi:hypothetical protein
LPPLRLKGHFSEIFVKKPYWTPGSKTHRKVWVFLKIDTPEILNSQAYLDLSIIIYYVPVDRGSNWRILLQVSCNALNLSSFLFFMTVIYLFDLRRTITFRFVQLFFIFAWK